MTLTLLRLARGLAWSRAPEQRWRQLAVPISALIFMVLMVVSTSVIAMVDRQASREAARQPILSSHPAATDLFLQAVPDYWHGRSILVRWIKPTDPTARPVLPPGLHRLPAPGQAVVSPELDRLADQHPALAARYPHRLTMDSDGIVSGDELIAYVRPQEGRHLGDEAAAVHREGTRFVGDSSVRRVSGFGGTGLGVSSDVIPLYWVALGMLAFGLGPGLVMLAVGLAAGSRLRDHRFQVLSALGTPRRTIVGLAVMETQMLALVPVLVGTAVWGLIAPTVDTVPLTGYQVVAGDLTLPWWLLALEAAIGLGLCALLSTAVITMKRQGRAQGRPVVEGTSTTRKAGIPLLAALAAFTLAHVVGGWELGVSLYIVTVALAVIGVPLVMPALLRTAGQRLSRSSSAAVHLAGASMVWDPKRIGRPFIGVSALLLLLVVTAGQIAIARYVEPPPFEAADATAIGVRWHDHRAGDLQAFSRAVRGGLVAPLDQNDSENKPQPTGEGKLLPPEAGHSSVTLGTTCQAVARILKAPGCDPAHPWALTEEMASELSAILSPLTPTPQPKVVLAPADRSPQEGSVVVMSRLPANVLDERVRTAAITTLPAPQVSSPATHFQARDSRWGWIFAGITLTVATLGIGSAMSVVDRMLAGRRRHQHLSTLGMSSRQMTRLGGVLFVMPYSLAAAIGFVIGFAICASGLYPDIPLPWTELGAIAIAAVIVAGLGASAVAVLGTRATLHAQD